MLRVCPLKSTSFAPRSGLPRKYAVHAAPLWEARPAANAEVTALNSTSFAPRSGLPQKYAVHAAPLWEARPAANAEGCPLRSISFAPRSGLPQKICSAGGAIVGSAIRGEWGGLPAQSTSFAPGSGLPHEYAVHAAPLWEPRPAANAEVCPLKSTSFARGRASHRKICSARGAIVGAATRGECGGLPAQKHKLRPEVGPPTENMQCTRRHCGRRAPRRMQVCPLNSTSFAPGAGLPQKICSARGGPN